MAILVGQDVLPLFAVENTSAGIVAPTAFLGTGFVVADMVLVTCWHVVRDAAEADQVVAAVSQDAAGVYVSRPISLIERHPAGHDLATARIGLRRSLPWTLAAEDPSAGINVFTYGYPMTTGRRSSTEQRQRFDLQSRYLEGYVTRSFFYDPPGFSKTPTYELDMLGPAGLSGAPLVKRPGTELMGVVYGTADAYSIAEIARIDDEAGESVPEVRRIVSFGLATYVTVLGELYGAATGGQSIRELIGQA